MDDATKLIVGAWSAVFAREIGPDDDFFDLEGDSLLGIHLVAALNKVGVPINIADIYEFSTPKTLTEFVVAEGILSQEGRVGKVSRPPSDWPDSHSIEETASELLRLAQRGSSLPKDDGYGDWVEVSRTLIELMRNDQERRRNIRLPGTLRLNVVKADGSRVESKGLDLSLAGLRIEGVQGAVGDRVRLEFNTDAAPTVVSTSAEIVRLDEESTGVKFQGVGEAPWKGFFWKLYRPLFFALLKELATEESP